MRATAARKINFPGLYRANHVPFWQRLHQNHDGVRQWDKGPRAKIMLYPYYALMGATTGVSTYLMIRMVLGHKTWY
ncbi:hypothetical protein K431DRAFT_300249 [Polychaeton citri CBS 116435]|uniref:Uncharacterized protein n=1 Tax=Polychaeton citri CBS 116435 TaxID=1314669 RepID=A0A9P4QGX9_9PEZI|nr:hypothetical protein K431DRAFT_300249 [Polychaeton citri CBS 116435]